MSPVCLSVCAAMLAAGGGTAAATDNQWTITSPDGKLAVTVGLLKVGDVPGYPADKVRLYYRIEHGPAGKRVEVLPWSPLGIELGEQSFVDDLQDVGGPTADPRTYAASDVPQLPGVVQRRDTAEFSKTYTMPHGKRSVCRVTAVEALFFFSKPMCDHLYVTFRVSNDGVAFRFEFSGRDDSLRTVTSELTGFRLPADTQAWMTPYQAAGKYTPAYEADYLEVAAGTPSPQKDGWAFPALFRVAGGKRWVLITEAAVDEKYCGCRLAREAPGNVYRIRLPDKKEGWGQGSVEPASRLPWTMPWRVVMVADSLAGIVESTLIDDLNPPSRVKDVSWIKPGRAAWSWWSDHDSPQDFRKLREFVDLAAEMGWEYFLVNANWTLMDHGNVRELAEYARQKGVGLMLWYNSGGEHNVVTEKPRGCMKAAEVRKFEFELLRKWGIKGVKIDFFQSDKQNIMEMYHGILRDAAEHQIMVNFHGCTVPRGWQRTWPHLMSMEAVRGEECYTFAADYPAKAPQYNTVLPFTRNVVGPMDYTPCAFTDDKYPHLTTNAHELALTVVFETGLLHFADRVSAYRALPAAVKQFLREVPVAWDDIRFISGEPGHSVVLARRKGDHWYVGAISGQKETLKVSVPLRFLGDGTYEGTLIGDGPEPRSFAMRDVSVRAGDAIDITMLPYGGAAVRLKPKR